MKEGINISSYTKGSFQTVTLVNDFSLILEIVYVYVLGTLILFFSCNIWKFLFKHEGIVPGESYQWKSFVMSLSICYNFSGQIFA
jgi:hypothetical protein